MENYWTVKKLIEKLSKYDENMRVVGFHAIEQKYIQHTEVQIVGNQTSVVTTGWENVVSLE